VTTRITYQSIALQFCRGFRHSVAPYSKHVGDQFLRHQEIGSFETI
jgi:hypothetical protein